MFLSPISGFPTKTKQPFAADNMLSSINCCFRPASHCSALQEELVSKVEKMRQAILEGINLSRPLPPPPPLPPPAFLPPAMVPPFYPMPLYPPRPMGGMPPHHPHHPHHPGQHRPRAFPGTLQFNTHMVLQTRWMYMSSKLQVKMSVCVERRKMQLIKISKTKWRLS